MAAALQAGLALRRFARPREELPYIELEILARRAVAHHAVVHRPREVARQVRVHGPFHDHVRAVIAEVEARDAADAHCRLAAELLVVVLEVRLDALAAFFAAILIAAARSGADEEMLLKRVLHATNRLPASSRFFRSFGEHASAYTRATGSVPDNRNSSHVESLKISFTPSVVFTRSTFSPSSSAGGLASFAASESFSCCVSFMSMRLE